MNLDSASTKIVIDLQVVINRMTLLKAKPEEVDPRCLSLAMTKVEEAMLWLANGQK